jgi:RimJ/RimL family protein N-acetyltransferase
MNDVEEVAASWKLDEGAISLKEAEDKITWMLDNHRQNMPGRLVHLCLAIYEKDTQELIGWCGLDQRAQSRKYPVLFYLLKASRWGRGLATEAARALLDFAFDSLGLFRIDGDAAADNLASQRVMEKIGMVYSGIDQEGGHAYTIVHLEVSHASRQSGAKIFPDL